MQNTLPSELNTYPKNFLVPVLHLCIPVLTITNTTLFLFYKSKDLQKFAKRFFFKSPPLVAVVAE